MDLISNLDDNAISHIRDIKERIFGLLILDQDDETFQQQAAADFRHIADIIGLAGSDLLRQGFDLS